MYPFSWIYQVIFWIDQKRKKKIQLPVDLSISIGNLSLGGTGKTPFTIHLAKLIQTILTQPKITILSRGYGGAWSKDGGLVEHDSDPRLAGDEPVMIQNQLKNVKLLVGRNRIHTFFKFSSKSDIYCAKKYDHTHLTKINSNAIKEKSNALNENSNALNENSNVLNEKYNVLNENSNVLNEKSNVLNEKSNVLNEKSNVLNENKHILILDDGFQHNAVHRDIDIVLVDAFRPEDNGRTIPSGRLREKISGLSRAQILLFTRCVLSSNGIDFNHNWEEKIRFQFPHLKIFHALEEKLGYFTVNEWKSQLECDPERHYNHGFLKNKKVFAFCGLANPKPFFDSIQNESPLLLKTKSYKDHYEFLDGDIEFWNKMFNDFDFFICSEKDIVKFYNRIPKALMEKIYFLRIETRIFEEEEWIAFWRNVLVPMKMQ